MARLLAPLAGASLLALALPAAAQQHDHHPAAPPAPAPRQTPAPAHPPEHQHQAPAPAADPHAGHDMSGMDHAAHAPDHGMTGTLGPWPMTREASGTAWQPDASSHGGVHWGSGDWSFMGHAQLNLTYDWQNGPRGDDKTFVSGMIMGSARRDFADGSTLNLRAMLSPDPFMGKDGFPLLLAAGETADGVTPLVDRQHPHELVMELSASYARPLTDKDTVFAYIGYPGEPAFGPPAFMHRMSAMDSPEAPITHHWLDSTHIVFGVATLGWAHENLKLEASSFTGREPDQNRYDFDPPELDSWSVRGTWNPTAEWSLQASYADVTGPEQLEPDENDRKLSASAIHTRRIGADGWWSTTLAWGRKTDDHDESKDGWMLESAFSPDDRWTVFARAERIETDELVPGHGGGHGDLYTVSKASVGAVRDWQVAQNVRFGLGALYTVNQVPGALEPIYGGDPDGGMIFMRVKVQ
jgi:hypothetical protein